MLGYFKIHFVPFCFPNVATRKLINELVACVILQMDGKLDQPNEGRGNCALRPRPQSPGTQNGLAHCRYPENLGVKTFDVRTVHTGLCSLPDGQQGALEERGLHRELSCGACHPAAPSPCVAPPAPCPPGTPRAPPAWSGSPFTTSSSRCWELAAQLKGEGTLPPTLAWPTCESCGAPSTSGSQVYLLPQPTEEPGTSPLPAATVLGTLSRGEDSRGRPSMCQEASQAVRDPGAGTQGTGLGPCIRRHTRAPERLTVLSAPQGRQQRD